MGAKTLVHVDVGMFGLPPVMDHETGESAYIGGWWNVIKGGFYIVSLLQPKGKAAVFCIAHQRIFAINAKCPECAEITVQAEISGAVSQCVTPPNLSAK